MKNVSFTVPYPIGTYLIKNENGIDHLDQVNKYIVDENGISAILTLDVKTDPRLSTAISIDSLLQNWKEDTSIHLSGDIGTKLILNLPHEDKPIIEEGPVLMLKK